MSKNNKRRKKIRSSGAVLAQRPLNATLQARFEVGMAACPSGQDTNTSLPDGCISPTTTTAM
tara:strand:- start:12 stop:197 length:186 start_codon:yes stop_codon:yes gene_type:complete